MVGADSVTDKSAALEGTQEMERSSLAVGGMGSVNERDAEEKGGRGAGGGMSFRVSWWEKSSVVGAVRDRTRRAVEGGRGMEGRTQPSGEVPQERGAGVTDGVGVGVYVAVSVERALGEASADIEDMALGDRDACCEREAVRVLLKDGDAHAESVLKRVLESEDVAADESDGACVKVGGDVPLGVSDEVGV